MDQDGLHILEDQCIQEHNPACMATCPARVDVRGLCSEISKGDFTAALKIYRKSIPFPGIISRICDEPCRNECIRKDAGEAISIARIERSSEEFGEKPDSSHTIPHREYRLAVIGAGLFGLTAAYDLAKKGYQVTVFEKTDRPGGSIRKFDETILSSDVIGQDCQVLYDLGVKFEFTSPVEKIVSVDEKQFTVRNHVFDAILISSGSNSHDFSGINKDTEGFLIDPISYETSIPGIFSGGDAVSWKNGPAFRKKSSPIFTLADGHRAATSIDRYFQNVSLTAARLKEGSYDTKLFTSIEGISSSKAIVPANNSYSKEEAIEEAKRCLLCQCLECVKVCEYLKEYGSYPKRYVREIYNNLSIVKGERRKNQFINSCSLCGLCGEVCPTDLNMATVCRDSRQDMVKTNRMPPSAHDFALRDMQFSNGKYFSLFRNQPGTDQSKYLFFPGCQLSASNPEYVEKLYGLLQEIPELKGNGGVGLALRCCGAPARWAGREEIFLQNRNEFLKEYSLLGKPEIIIACSSCYQVFKEEYPDIPIRSLYTVLEGTELVKNLTFLTSDQTISIHDPCTTRYEHSIHESVRNIVTDIGYHIDELPLNREKTECCSYGGLMWLANPELAKKVVNRRINESQNVYVTYCAMCRDFFNKQGKTTFHVLDLLLNNNQDLSQPVVIDYSQRHTNRINLKNRLLEYVWKEKMENAENLFPFELNISDQVRAILDERHILIEDIQKVLQHADKTGLTLINKSNGHLLTYHCPDYVTYWVEYTKTDTTYIIHNAYSHRMVIDERSKS
jgi:glutamate synthase (NADPH) small chain